MKKIAMKKSAAAAAAAVMMFAGIPAVNAGAASSTTYTDSTPYYSGVTHLYYTTQAEAASASDTNYYYYNGRYYNNGYYYNGVYYRYNSSYPYYSTKTGQYYSNYNDAVAASGNDSSYVVTVGTYSGSGSYYYSSSYPYYSSVTGRYYATQAAAIADSGNNANAVTYLPSSTYYYGYNNYYYPYYYYDYGYYPYYYTKSSKKVAATSSVDAAPGVPYSYGNKRFWGWTNLAYSISNLKAGSTYTIDMNGSTIVPTEVLKVVKQRDIYLQLVLSNGVIWNIYGGNVSDTDEIDLGVAYDTESVPKDLIGAAKKSNNAVSVAQITVGNGTTGSLGLAGKASVKFSAKRANCFVKVYLYDEAEGNLKLVDKTIVNSKGRAEITLRYSGNYLLVLS